MTVEEAKVACTKLVGCRGFTFKGSLTDGKVQIHFKSKWDIQGEGWTSLCFEPTNPSVSRHDGFIPAGDDLEMQMMTLEQAMSRCQELAGVGCKGFTFEGAAPHPHVPVMVYFKSKWDLRGSGWTSYRFRPLERYVLDSTRFLLGQYGAPGYGVAWHAAPSVDEVDGTAAGPLWGDVVEGRLVDEEWLQVGGRFLPTRLRGVEILARAAPGGAQAAPQQAHRVCIWCSQGPFVTAAPSQRGSFSGEAEAQRPGARTDGKKRVLLVGEAGAGKTCLLQLLNGVRLVDAPASELATDDVVALQRLAAGEVSTKSVRQVDVRVGGCELCLIDTPGFADSSGTPAEGSEDLAHARFVAEALRSAESLHCVLLVVNGTQARLNPSVGHTMKIIRKHMPRDILQKTVVVFTYVESENRRPFAVEQLTGAVFDGEPPKERLVHLENPLGQLTGMSESDLRAMLDGDESEAKDDLRREIAKGVKVAKDLVKTMEGYAAFRSSASFSTSFRQC